MNEFTVNTDHGPIVIAAKDQADAERIAKDDGYRVYVKPPSFAEKVVDKIIADLTDRRGLRQEWENCDDEVRDEIRATWIKLINEVKGD